MVLIVSFAFRKNLVFVHPQQNVVFVVEISLVVTAIFSLQSALNLKY